MKFIILSSAALAALAPLAQAAYPISGTTVNCRAGPTTDSAVVRTFKKDDKVTIVCQTQGPDVNGNSIWDKTTDGCYVADYFVRTGTSKYVADPCGASSATASATASTTASATKTAAAESESESESTTVVIPPTSPAVPVPTGSNSTAPVPTGSATSTRGPAISTTPVPARAAGVEMLRGAYLALPLLLLGMA